MANTLRKCALVMLAFASSARAVDANLEPHQIPRTPFEQHRVADDLGRTITYYVSHPRKPQAPILLMIQGSGCSPVMHVQEGHTYSTLFGFGPFAQEGDFT